MERYTERFSVSPSLTPGTGVPSLTSSRRISSCGLLYVEVGIGPNSCPVSSIVSSEGNGYYTARLIGLTERTTLVPFWDSSYSRYEEDYHNYGIVLSPTPDFKFISMDVSIRVSPDSAGTKLPRNDLFYRNPKLKVLVCPYPLTLF